MSPESDIHFLLVEDDPDHAELVSYSLEKGWDGNIVTHVSDGVEALNYLRKRPPYRHVPTPNVVILDLKMPKIDGFEVLERIRSNPRLKDLQVVILTSSRDTRDLERAKIFDPAGYLIKPVDSDQFNKLIKELSTRLDAEVVPAGE
ncbi:MAG: response regulator [Verrucomicrobiales bacterium]|nr:response regulator [Verrucomicrobiales bacterium]